MMQATYFDQKFHATFFLAPEDPGMATQKSLRTPTPARKAQADAALEEHGQQAEAEEQWERRPQFASESRFQESSEDKNGNPILRQSDANREAAAHISSELAAETTGYRESVMKRAPWPLEAGKIERLDGESADENTKAEQHIESSPGDVDLDMEMQEELLATIEEQDEALRY
jgi:hypothetical protein